jgi:UDP-N-acetylmuramate dehydrogenase
MPESEEGGSGGVAAPRGTDSERQGLRSPRDKEEEDALDLLARQLREKLRGKVEQDVPIARFTSFRVGGPAAILVEPADAADLSTVGEAMGSPEIEIFVLGRGTNVLVSDHGFSGLVVRLGKAFDWIAERGDEGLEAGGATPLPQVANRAARLGLTGLEFGIAIPATVGGAVRMNAGAHASAVAEVVHEVQVCTLPGGVLKTLDAAALGMKYRSSRLGPGDVVVSATFALDPAEKGEIAGRMEQYRDHRTETQPVDAPNAGSMFKNPTGDTEFMRSGLPTEFMRSGLPTAGALIEKAGLKGFRIGNAEVSQKHANFFLAHTGAKAQDIHDIMAAVQKAVNEKFDILLIPEVRPLGVFERADALRLEHPAR